MKTNYVTQRETAPSAFVTKGRQRVKQYDNAVFLKDGDEFEIELYNPTTSKVLAKIKLNGILISSTGMVLRPGERSFLERYIDDPRKFKFETYEIDGSNENSVRAIANNGSLEVEFFSEYINNNITYNTGSAITWTYYAGDYPFNTITSAGTCLTDKGVKFGGHATSQGISSSPVVTCYHMSTGDVTLENAPIETGRVEKGKKSDQYFGTDSTSFNSYSSWKSVWKILPESQKVLVKEDIKIFCTNCGAKRKKSSHHFCPYCGTQFMY
jgi:hypothetical protein